jgi:hypothetical protein
MSVAACVIIAPFWRGSCTTTTTFADWFIPHGPEAATYLHAVTYTYSTRPTQYLPTYLPTYYYVHSPPHPIQSPTWNVAHATVPPALPNIIHPATQSTGPAQSCHPRE